MEIKKISDYIWEIPATEKEGMLVPARIYATEKLLGEMDKGVFEQVTNVACLPGIQKFSYCMPDGHWGYGFPIGGVAAFSREDGVISPGGIGFDINCGMRLIRTDLTVSEVKPRIRELIDILFKTVPAGVGSKGLVKLSVEEFKQVMIRGVNWCIEKGYGWEHDTERIEEYGCIPGADPSRVSEKAISRGISQLGTLGSGNHYLEIQVATPEKIFDKNMAKALGIFENQILVMVHCGSRGFGHQVATDYLKIFDTAMRKYGMVVRDRELACAPFNSPEGQDYYKAMACAANAAFANRQVIVHRVREGFSQVFGREPEELGMDIIYDVAHNVAKIETHEVDGEEKELLVHRKGSTRCFGPGRKEIPEIYRKIGQPVIVGGSMETGSYLLIGTEKAMKETFGSTMHGSGRTMSRTAAKKKVIGAELKKEMERAGIIVRAVSMAGLAEEAGFAYKDISEVVDTMEMAGISRKVVGLRPIGNIKG
jgi:tRNA-splicing ligase RtcB